MSSPVHRSRCTDLGQVKTCTISTIVVIPVHVEDLLALDGQQSGEDTFGQTGAQDDDLRAISVTIGALRRQKGDGMYIVLFIHCS